MGKTTIPSIISSGSNNNGNWIKFADGIMICFGQESNKSSGDQITYPQYFIYTPKIAITPRWSSQASARCVYSTTSVSLQNFNVKAWDTSTNAESASSALDFYYIAIGVWK